MRKFSWCQNGYTVQEISPVNEAILPVPKAGPVTITVSFQTGPAFMQTPRIFFAATLAVLLIPLAVQAAPDNELLALINAYRADPPACEGSQNKPAPPLSPEPKLTGIRLAGDIKLQGAMRASGYHAARAEVMTLSGPSDAKAALRFAAKLNCRLLLSRQYTVAGVSRHGKEWQIVLARPLLDPDLGHWRDAGREVLNLVNAARAKGRRCGNEHHQAAPALRWSEKLGAAARAHSHDMAEKNYFAHESRNGETVGDRAKEQGYAWRVIGENIAAGQSSPRKVVDGWLSSPGHCANIMKKTFTEMGAAYAINPTSDTIIYWTQVFGTPR